MEGDCKALVSGMKSRNRLYVLLLGTVIAMLAWAWQFETPPPDLMETLAASAGLRPVAAPFALMWHYIASPLCRNFGLPTAETVLRLAGHASLGFLAIMVTVLFRMLLPASLVRGEHIAMWWRTAVRFVLFQGVALFCLSDPVWSAFRWFSPAALQVLLVTVATLCYVVHFRTDRRAPLFAAFALLGLLSADTPVGIVMLLLAVAGLCVRRYLRSCGLLPAPEENPLADSFMSLRLTIAFTVGAVAGFELEIKAFEALDGLAAFGWTWSDYACQVPFSYIKALLATCSPVGVTLIVFVAVVPALVEFLLIGRATDDEKHLVYLHGTMFLLSGLVAFSQLTGAKPLWFWTWGGGCVSDGVLKCFSMGLCALSTVWALAVFTIELYLRNFRRIETLRSQDAAESEGATEAFSMARRLQRTVRACLLAEPLLVFACVLPFRAQGLERAMLRVVADAARETAEECREVRYLFTDGGLDAAVELAAAESGRRLTALSMMGGAEDKREMFLRTRDAADATDKALLESGAADALRTWVRTRPDKAGTYAVQIGFELWRRDGKSLPECSGLVARPEGLSPDEAARGAAAGRRLAKRLLALYEGDSPGDIADRALRDAFLFVQWRLAILARHRANAYDMRGDADLAMEETRLADALDKKNGALARIRETMAWASRRKLERMTPQEGLRLGLSRADFAFARVFALRVLDIDPDDPSANFALGMDFFVQKQYARAQAYLSRCLVRRPNDPAVLNNLAQCHLRQGDPAAALPFAERALEILPDSAEIKRTVARVKAALGR